MALFQGGGGGSVPAHVVTYDSATGQQSADGSVIPPALPIAWADFILLDWTQLDGIYYRVTDKHSVGTTGGSLWQADASGNRPVLISEPIRTTGAAAPSAVTYPGLRIFQTDYGAFGAYKTSNGTDYILDNATVVHKDHLTSNVLVLPSVAATAAADNAGTVRITFGSAHNIATVGTPAAMLYVTATANGFTAGDWLPITAITSATVIDVSTSSSGKTGAPTLATVASASVVPMETITLPALNTNSEVTIELLTFATYTANAKNLTVKLGSTTFFAPTMTSSVVTGAYTSQIFKISNRNSKSVQVGSIGNLSALGVITSSNSAPATGTENTGGALNLVLSWQPTTVNERMYFEKVRITITD